MRLRRRLVATIVLLIALGLATVDFVTLSSLHSYLYGRVDSQLTATSSLISSYVTRADHHGFTVNAKTIRSRVSPYVYVELVDPHGAVTVSVPSGTQGQVDPAPELPTSLSPISALPRKALPKAGSVYHPNATSISVGSVGTGGTQYRLLATSLPGETLIVATSLTSTDATLTSLRNIELALSAALLIALALLLAILLRVGLRPLEDMTKDADAIAAGDLSRRVQPTEGDGEIARLGRALNGMLTQIETAFAQRALSEERLRSFLADASHELRTPLTSIRGYAELLQKDAFAEESDRSRALSRIEKEAARMGVLVGDLSLLAREGEGPEPARYRVDLAAVAAEAVEDARTLDPSRRIELEAPAEVPVSGDDARLEQMVHNLLGNALTHTPAGTPVEVGVAVRGSNAVLEVRDSGPGLSPEQAGRVFDRFYRGDSERLDGGSGLGLFIVASLARTFGGGASVDSALGKGSTFRVVLPVCDGSCPEDQERAHRGAGLN
jgi:two-component system, OmpR family, sensor kinase